MFEWRFWSNVVAGVLHHVDHWMVAVGLVADVDSAGPGKIDHHVDRRRSRDNNHRRF